METDVGMKRRRNDDANKDGNYNDSDVDYNNGDKTTTKATAKTIFLPKIVLRALIG